MASRQTYGWAWLEERYRRPIREIIAETYAASGSMVTAAETLGLPPTTLYGWCRQLGIKIVRASLVWPETTDVA